MKKRHSGFTLIEVLVVVAIVAVMAGTVSLSFLGGESRSLRHEADRLAVLLRAAREQSVLENRPIIVAFERNGYRFLTTGLVGDLQTINDDPFRSRRLPNGISFGAINVSGTTGLSEPRLVFSPTGEATPTVCELMLGAEQALVRVQLDGIVIAGGSGA